MKKVLQDFVQCIAKWLRCAFLAKLIVYSYVLYYEYYVYYVYYVYYGLLCYIVVDVLAAQNTLAFESNFKKIKIPALTRQL